MSANESPVTLTLPRWYVEILSCEVEADVMEYERSVKWAAKHGTTEQQERIRAGQARYAAVESAITNALDGDA
jgi:hypothetical protein